MAASEAAQLEAQEQQSIMAGTGLKHPRGSSDASEPPPLQRPSWCMFLPHSVPQFPLCILRMSPLSRVFSRTSGKSTGYQWAPDSIQGQSLALSTLMGRVARGQSTYPSLFSSNGAAQGARVWVLPLGSAPGRISFASLLEGCWGLSLEQGTGDCCHLL